MENQTQAILSHLKSNKPITAIAALQLYGTMRLAARIKDLRDEGYRIETIMIDVGPKKRVAQYKMIATKDAQL